MIESSKTTLMLLRHGGWYWSLIKISKSSMLLVLVLLWSRSRRLIKIGKTALLLLSLLWKVGCLKASSSSSLTILIATTKGIPSTITGGGGGSISSWGVKCAQEITLWCCLFFGRDLSHGRLGC